MSEGTNIAWCDDTINFWEGCTKVSPGCANCYAEARDKRFTGGKLWGKGAPRRKSKSALALAHRLNRKPWICDGCGLAASTAFSGPDALHCPDCGGLAYHRRRIFSLSLGDIMDEEVEIDMLGEALLTIWKCRDCVWILCSKRWQNFTPRMKAVLNWAMERGGALYADTEANAFWWWLENWISGEQPPANIILLTSVENQAMADKRIPELLRIPAACHGLSLEPLLGPVDLITGHDYPAETWLEHLDWLIIGGESGPNARPCEARWIANLIEQGKAAGVPTFCKQLGAQSVWTLDGEPFVKKLADKKGGDINEWPVGFRIQEFPKL